MAASASADDILAVARDADAILVTYAKLPGELLRAAHALQGDRPLRPRRRQYRHQGRRPSWASRSPTCRTTACTRCPIMPWRFCSRSRARFRSPTSWCRPGAGKCRPVVPIHRLAGRVLGLVGFGNIPRALAPKAKAFGLRVVAHDPLRLARTRSRTPASRRVSFDELSGDLGLRLGPRPADAGDARPVQCGCVRAR